VAWLRDGEIDGRARAQMIARLAGSFTGLYEVFVAVSRWRRTIWLAMCQIFLGLGQKPLGLFWALAEPLVAIALVYAIRGLLRLNTPNYGTSLFLFFASGFLPYYLFLRLSTRTAYVRAGAERRLPGMSALDAYIANILVNALIWIVMIVAIFLGMMWLGGIREIQYIVVHTSAVPIVLLVVLAMGLGMINIAISRYLPFWLILYSILTRGLIVFSGVMQIVDLQTPRIRQYSIINPLSHGIEWFRLGIWERYPHNSLDKEYFITWVVVVLFMGMIVDRGTMRRVKGPN
jgi:capsular polysaccharide transport system permease protein